MCNCNHRARKERKKNSGKTPLRMSRRAIEREIEQRLAIEEQFNPPNNEGQRRVRAVLVRKEIEAKHEREAKRLAEMAKPKPARRSPTLREIAEREERKAVLAGVARAIARSENRGV